MIRKANQNIGLWWLSVISLTIGISIFVLLKPAEYEYNLDVQRYRSMALVGSIVITGLCVIIGTRGRWFGKGL